jgi:hypothetical protein
MTIAEAVRAALDEWAQSPEFDLDDATGLIEGHVDDAVIEWAIAHGYQQDDGGYWHRAS